MKLRSTKKPNEPTIALINIVFLMLVFFMVAGTLSKPPDPGLTLVRAADLEGRPPPDALVVYPDGAMRYHGGLVTDVEAFLDEQAIDTLRIVPDRATPAALLVQLGNAARSAGVARVVIVSEKALP